MEFLKKLFDFDKPGQLVKILGIGLVALVTIVVVSAAFKLVGSTISSVSPQGANKLFNLSRTETTDMMMEEAAMDGAYGMGAPSVSVRNVAPSPLPPVGGNTMGDNAEEFEVTEYNVTIETRDRERTCNELLNLKGRDYVIFENTNEYDDGCHFTFKVDVEHAEEILAIIDELNPRDLSANTYTIKRLVDDFTSEEEILLRKKESIESTLEDAITAYDQITAVATQTRDAQSLATIIDSKIRIIERLTEERIYVNEQLDRLQRAKAEQLDRLEYTYFYITVRENKYIDGEQLGDSWKAAIKTFVRDVNKTVQDITINLIALLFLIIQYAIYFLVLLVLAKYGWRFTKNFWNK